MKACKVDMFLRFPIKFLVVSMARYFWIDPTDVTLILYKL